MSNITHFLGIIIDYSRDSLINNFAMQLLKKHYMVEGEKSPQETFARAATAYCAEDLQLAQRIYDYVSNQYFMFASPVLSNASSEYYKSKGLPISCFLSYVPDSIDGLVEHSSEIKYLSVKGGGVGGHWSDVRSVSDVAPSPIPFIAETDRTMVAYRQGGTRKGSYAAYMDVSHPDIKEFLQMRIPTGGDVNRKSFNLNNAVNITDKFLHAVHNDDIWNLIDPHDKSIRDRLKARELWYLILETRFRTGEPYICYTDEANRRLSPILKEKGLKIHGSNLCSEIFLPTNEERTAVCCLSSLNLEYYDEWKNSQIIEDLITFLDNVLEDFIKKAPNVLQKAKYSAQSERSIGLGTMGFHALLRKKYLPFEGLQAKLLNKKIFKEIYEKSKKQSIILGLERGCYPDGEEYIENAVKDLLLDKRQEKILELRQKIGRNANLIAIAPNANSSIILNTSPSIEPMSGNAYTQKTRVGSFLVKCKYLEKKLESFGKNTDEIWSSIITNRGSVLHLDFLNEEDKNVFKTAFEIDQQWIISHARDRQEFIDQGQSINLFFCKGVPRKYVNKIHKQAFSLDGNGVPLKSLYYLRTEAAQYVGSISDKIKRIALEDGDQGCVSCEG